MKLEIEIHHITEDPSSWPPENVRVNFYLCSVPYIESGYRIGNKTHEHREDFQGISIKLWDYWFTLPEVKRP